MIKIDRNRRKKFLTLFVRILLELGFALWRTWNGSVCAKSQFVSVLFPVEDQDWKNGLDAGRVGF